MGRKLDIELWCGLCRGGIFGGVRSLDEQRVRKTHGRPWNKIVVEQMDFGVKQSIKASRSDVDFLIILRSHSDAFPFPALACDLPAGSVLLPALGVFPP